MSLVNAKCTSCGGDLQVDNTKDAWICPFCGTPFIVEKAINNFNVTNYNQIHANVVNIYGSETAEFVIRGGVLEKYNGNSTHVEIPNTVTHIGPAFKGYMSLISISIPESVKMISDEAFAGCCSLESVTIPDSVMMIGKNAFYNCMNLKHISISKNLKVIAESAFAKCVALSDITIPEGVMAIEASAFYGCTSLSSITIPDSIAKIDERAFGECPSLLNIKYKYLTQHSRLFPAYRLRRERIFRRECTYCGGSQFTLFTGICKKCGKHRDY